MTSVMKRTDLPVDASSHELEGYLHGDVPVCLIFFEGRPGRGPRLHRHPYAEIFIIQEGESTFTIGDKALVLSAGQIGIALPNQPHKFINSGQGPLRQLDIHCNPKFITEWLEGEGSNGVDLQIAADAGDAVSPIGLNELPHRGRSHRLEGKDFGVPVSLIFFDGETGSGPGLHRHPYPEVFTSVEGHALFTVGDETFEMDAGQIAIAPAMTPHKFINTSEGRLRQIDIHCGPEFIQEELEVRPMSSSSKA